MQAEGSRANLPNEPLRCNAIQGHDVVNVVSNSGDEEQNTEQKVMSHGRPQRTHCEQQGRPLHKKAHEKSSGIVVSQETEGEKKVCTMMKPRTKRIQVLGVKGYTESQIHNVDGNKVQDANSGQLVFTVDTLSGPEETFLSPGFVAVLGSQNGQAKRSS
eukprot:CAMPEP_0184970428 /NCGR_PEP_ID=MMETSP1098-20130426/2926_1 /TAXON_ID=89044 /ORGANISM="Spumella elongata, Strain CCAP 955/1" /LENGTH=158 /DNA_ID=CAMNT_0027492371 /DNA_START=293 /DNA_END=769 /DNA_ORIENTATION=+